MRRSVLTCSAVLTCLTLAFPAWSADWTVDKKSSSVGIVGKKMTGPITGTVNKWDGKINFDPNNLDKSHVIINVDVGSINMSDKQLDQILPQPDWLSAKIFPQATFESTSISHVGGNAYEAAGTVTIRGVKQNVALPFTVDMDERTARAQGFLSLIRTDFGIGGLLGDVPDMGIMVGVTFDLTATK